MNRIRLFFFLALAFAVVAGTCAAGAQETRYEQFRAHNAEMTALEPSWMGPLTHSDAEPPPFLHLSGTAWAALAISGLFCTALTTLLWNWGIHHVPASRAGVFLNIEPALGSWLGVQLLGEHLGPYAWLGGGLILAAAITLTARGHRPGSVAEPEVILE